MWVDFFFQYIKFLLELQLFDLLSLRHRFLHFFNDIDDFP